MTFDLYLAYLATVGVFFATPPGPSQILIISNSLRHGLRSSLATVAGDLSANACQMTAAAFGLAAVIATSAHALTIVKWAGVAYLVWVGIRTFRATPRGFDGSGGPQTSPGRLFRQGFVTSASNPKAVFFFAALFPQFIDPAIPIWPQLLVLGVTYLAVDGVLLVVWGGAADRLLAGLRRRGRLLNRLSGSLMIGAAALLAFRDTTVVRPR
ncbi:MAG: LysE family translocator [Inquilinaceae bacterium]